MMDLLRNATTQIRDLQKVIGKIRQTHLPSEVQLDVPHTDNGGLNDETNRTANFVLHAEVNTARVSSHENSTIPFQELQEVVWKLKNDQTLAGLQLQALQSQNAALKEEVNWTTAALKTSNLDFQKKLDTTASDEKSLEVKAALLSRKITRQSSDIFFLHEEIERMKSHAKFNRTLAFLHIGKTGGTSFDNMGERIANEAGFSYEGNKHFDWSHIVNSIGTVGKDVEVVTILREPVARAISHYYFTKQEKWVGDTSFRNQSLAEFLHDKDNLLEFRDIWQDGQAGISWLTGLHIGAWVGVPRDQVEERENTAKNSHTMMQLAADRLEQTKWFAILEDMDRAMELLQHELKLNERPTLARSNPSKLNHAIVEEEQRNELASLMPQDIWLYEYAKRLFEARWNRYKTGIYKSPERPPFPNVTCISTRSELNCTSGPLRGVF